MITLKKYSVVAVSVLLGLFLSCAPEKADREQWIVTADGLNPVSSDFPGGRGADQLIIYTPDFGDSTGTNKYGIEAIVANGFVVTVGGNNSRIPADGFVLSGHGKMSRWISDHLHPGLRVRLEGKTVAVSRTAQSDLLYARYFLEQSAGILNETGQSGRMDSLHIYRDGVSRLLQEGNADGPEGARLLKQARHFYFRSFPSLQGEVRAVWYHLREKSVGELENTFREMAQLGVNTICPETIYGGYAIYPDAHVDLPQNPQFAGWDPLAEMIRLGKKYHIRVIPWVWTYYIGRDQSPLVQSKQDQLAVSRLGEHPSRLERGYYFLCPARQEVRQFWLEVYATMLKRYDVGGLQLDYIRYPVSQPWQKGFCYCDHCRELFRQESGFDPSNISPDENPDVWQQWTGFRVRQVTQFVSRVSALVDSIKPQVPLSADVFPDVEESIFTKCQDWGTWLEKNYLDEIFTMSYTPDVQTVREEARYLAGRTSVNQPGYVGLGPYQKFRPEILLQEIYEVQKSGVQGVCLFEYGSLSPAQKAALKMGPFKQTNR